MLTHVKKYNLSGRLPLIALATLPLAACSGASVVQDGLISTQDFSQAISSHEAAALYNEQANIPASMVVVRMRDSTSGILSATQRTYQNGFSQRVVYPMARGGQGENYIDTRIAGRRLDRKRNDKLLLHSSRASDIVADAARSMPVAKVDLSQQGIYRNAYGPFGMLFIKSANEVNCLFGWQTLTDENTSLSDGNGLGNSASWPSRQGLSYRLRYCDTGLQKEDAQNLMERIELKPDFARLWQSGDAVSLAPVAAKITPAPSVRKQVSLGKRALIKTKEKVSIPHPETDQTVATISATSNPSVPAPNPLLLKVPSADLAETAYLVPAP
ncbi:cellulose biosynthesis protein BcsN [Cohaesibacter celericrescens]|uniref:Cellulose biosynthesis protein BcsN n=1 Tax=Cohaesibacter celericrescens TaxID=2067669 RepID=A0A2N5XV54_9HYPH|nr:cellulose biosynthesis protein BcsN [Cohaesibacter celericrescens]PLW78393.1 hypothetical protein C0081_04675 [Cohaesibacter celericrescens]